MAVVVFDPDEFRELYPKFEDMSDARLSGFFATACVYLDNSESSSVPYDPDEGVETRKILLYLLVCHLASLSLWPTGAAGPMTSATEGSVSAGYGTVTTASGQWYSLTPCGQAFWQAMMPYMIGGRYYPLKKYHPWG